MTTVMTRTIAAMTKHSSIQWCWNKYENWGTHLWHKAPKKIFLLCPSTFWLYK